jgi:hypothetical protein
MSLQDIRDALDAALVALSIRPVQETDRAPNVTGSTCAAMVEWAGANYLVAFGGQTNDATFNVVVLAGRASERAARQKLDVLVDPSPNSTTALRNTLNGDLGNTVGFCQVASASEYRNYSVGEVDYLGCEFTVVIGT